MSDDDLTARLRAWADAWDDLHGDRLASASTIRADGQTHALRSAEVRALLGLIDSLTRERDELAATVERLAEAIERAHPWVEYLLAHVAVDWSPPEEEVLRRDVEFVRQVAADTEEVGDRG